LIFILLDSNALLETWLLHYYFNPQTDLTLNHQIGKYRVNLI